jgi:hypothetical protein
LYIAGGWLLPGRKRIIPYSIQTLKRLKPAFFREDLVTLFGLLQRQEIRPLIARRFPLAEAARAQELLEKGGVIGKIVLVCASRSLSDKDVRAETEQVVRKRSEQVRSSAHWRRIPARDRSDPSHVPACSPR